MPKHLELSPNEIVNNLVLTHEVSVRPEDITHIKSFGRPTYVVDTGGQVTFLCRRSNLGTIQQRIVKWYGEEYLELNKNEIIKNLVLTYGVLVNPEDITEIKSFGQHTYVVDTGNQITFLCRRSNLGTIQQRIVKWWH